MPTKPIGPCPAEVMVIGEAAGEQEDKSGIPFVGAAGQELRRMLTQAGLDPLAMRMTNVFDFRPPEDGKLERLCGKKADAGKDYPYPPLSQGKYFLPKFADPALARLRSEIIAASPKLILALGNAPCWALLRRTGISKLRGSLFPNELLPGGPPVLPVYHPSMILANWSNRPIVVQDFDKAKRFLAGGIKTPRRELWLAPTIEEFEDFAARFIFRFPRPPLLSFDVETLGGTVTCIGFSPRPDLAITVPFYDPDAKDKNYWPDHATELRAWRLVRRILESSIPKLGQNGLYDIQYCYRWKIKVNNYVHDTMIRHHALYPELEKGLGFMGTIYTDEAPWKLLRKRNKDNFKLDDA